MNDLVAKVYQSAVSKGLWSEVSSAKEIHDCISQELEEATYEIGSPDLYFDGDIPKGEAVELMDVVLMVMSYYGYKGWDFDKIFKLKHDYNQTRSYKHLGV